MSLEAGERTSGRLNDRARFRARIGKPSNRVLLAVAALAVMATARVSGTNPGAASGSSTQPNGSAPGPGTALRTTATSATTPPAPVVHPASCQPQWAGSAAPLNPRARPGLSTELVPTAPEVMTICRYAGLNQKVAFGALEASRTIGGKALTEFVGYLDSPGWHVVRKGAIFCPFSQGSTDLLEFVYPSGPPVTVSVAISGCSFVSNGVRTVTGAAIGARLARWVGADSVPQ